MARDPTYEMLNDPPLSLEVNRSFAALQARERARDSVKTCNPCFRLFVFFVPTIDRVRCPVGIRTRVLTLDKK